MLGRRVRPVIDGASGGAAAWNESDGSELPLAPMAFESVTLHVYMLPLVSPVTVIGLAAPLAENAPHDIV